MLHFECGANDSVDDRGYSSRGNKEDREMPGKRMRFLLFAFLAFCICGSFECLAQGLIIPGVGAKNRSFGGAATGNAIDGPGALFFNPATMTKLDGNQIVIGVEIPFISEQVSSSLPGLSGQTDAEVGIFPLSTTSVIYRPDPDSDWTYGLGMFSAGGIFSNYPGDDSNPILQPPPPNGVGAGQLFSLLSLLQFTPAISAKLTDRLSIGGGPVVTMTTVQLAPVTLAAPDDADGDGFFSYPYAIGTHPHYGLGFQIGAYFTGQSGLNLGFSYKSPNWFETIKINAQDELRRARRLEFDFDLPPVYSFGISYEGIPDWLIAADLRLVDYDSVPILSDSGFNADGSVRGLGWESVWSLSLGIQYECSDWTSLRTGWFVTENPIPDSVAAFNVGAPAYYQNILSAGLSHRFTEAIEAHFTYYHAPQTEISGPFVAPTGPVPGTNVTDSVSSHAILLSCQFDY